MTKHSSPINSEKIANNDRETDAIARAYNFFGDHLWKRYGKRVLKLSIDAGLSCPNIDGTTGVRGCVFCSAGSASPTARARRDILEQMALARNSFRRADSMTRYIAYFQAYTGTYESPENLKSLYDRALEFPGLTGLMIATRPDALPDEVIDLIASYSRDDFELWIEIGMQTMHDGSLRWLGRGHDHAATVDAVERIAVRGVPVCAHIILGIPGETWSDMMETAVEVSRLPVSGIKFHQLHVIEGTRLEELWRRGGIELPGFREYVSTLCDFLERTRPDIMVHRLLADREERSLVAPLWGTHKGTVLREIDDEFRRRHTFQGFLTDACAAVQQ